MLAQGFLHPGREFARLGSVRPSRNGCARRRRSRGSGCGNLFMGNASWIRNIACPISTSSITISLLCAMRWPSDLSREAGDKHWRAKRSQSPSRSTAQASSLSWRASLLTARRKISFAGLPLKRIRLATNHLRKSLGVGIANPLDHRLIVEWVADWGIWRRRRNNSRFMKIRIF